MNKNAIKVIGKKTDGTEIPRGTLSWRLTSNHFKCIDTLHNNGVSKVIVEFNEDGEAHIYAEQEQPINLFSI
tara:strand:- start:853 stop:1068 length:216 start_codon:yes stop_codon:yes gene_type:complete